MPKLLELSDIARLYHPAMLLHSCEERCVWQPLDALTFMGWIGGGKGGSGGGAGGKGGGGGGGGQIWMSGQPMHAAAAFVLQCLFHPALPHPAAAAFIHQTMLPLAGVTKESHHCAAQRWPLLVAGPFFI